MVVALAGGFISMTPGEGKDKTMREAKSGRGRLVVAGVAVALVMLQGLLYAEAKPFDRLVPDDVASFASVRNYRASVERLKATPYHGLLSEPEVKAFVNQLRGVVSQRLHVPTGLEGIRLADLEKLLAGEIAVASARQAPAQALGPFGIPIQGQVATLVLADVGGNTAEAERLLEHIAQAAAEKLGMKLTEEQYRGRKIRQLAPAAPEEMEDEVLEELPPELVEGMARLAQLEQQRFYMCVADGIVAFAAGADRSLLERHLTLRDGGDVTPLADSETYRTLLGRIDPESDYIQYQNLEAAWAQLETAAARPGMFLPVDPAKAVQALGLTSLKAQVSAVRLEDQGISGRSFLWAPAPRAGILKAAVPAGKANVRPPAFVGEDAIIYAGAYMDLPTLWTEIKGAIQVAAPAFYAQMMEQINSPQAPFHVERDLIQTFGSHWFLYVPQKVYDPDVPAINVVLAAELRDSEKLEGTLRGLLAMFLPPGQEPTRVMGKTIYKLPPLPVFPGPSGTGGLTVCLAFVDGKLLISTNPGMAERAVRDSARAQSPLLDEPRLRATLPHMIPQPESFVYADHRAIAQWIWNALDLLPVGPVAVPRLETVQKYLSISMTTTKWNDEGLETRTWIPFPAP